MPLFPCPYWHLLIVLCTHIQALALLSEIHRFFDPKVPPLGDFHIALKQPQSELECARVYC